MNPDVVIPYKMSYSEEMKYMLRSLSNVPHGEVWVIGDRPKFKVHHIPYNQTSDIAKNTLEILRIAVESDEISEDFIWMHDDHFIMNPIENIPIHHRGYYRDILKNYTERRRRNYYIDRMHRTYNKLFSLGIFNPICYELHIPFLINKDKWKAIDKYVTPDLNKLSMYGNLNKIGGTKIRDVKVRQKDTLPTGSFISTHDATFNINEAGRIVRETFAVRGKYEI